LDKKRTNSDQENRNDKIMRRIGVVISFWSLVASLGLSIVQLWGAEGIISKVPVPDTDYCYLRFPAIREETLSWPRPVLKDPSDGDIILMLGPCDYDPLGKAEVARQKAQLRRERSKDRQN
jgi:hypothetical protein